MNPYYQPRPTQTYHPPQQTRGFQPPLQKPRPQQGPYPQAEQAQAPVFAQHYQSQPQYQQQRPTQYFQQPQQYAHQQRYAPQPHPAPVQPLPGPHAASQSYYPPQAHNQSYSYASTPSYPQPRPGAVVPPLRTTSQSPDKAKRPLPDPAATAAAAAAGTARSRPISMSPTSVTGYGAPVQPQGHSHYSRGLTYAPSHSPTSSFSTPTAPSSFAQAPLQQSQPQSQLPSTPPRQPHPPISHSHSSPLNRTRTASSDNSVDSPPSKRPLPAPPGSGAVPSPPVTPGRSVAAPVPTQRRTLPFSPTKPPSVEEGINSKRGQIPSPKRSSTLPAPAGSAPPANEIIDRMDRTDTTDMRDIAGQSTTQATMRESSSSPSHAQSSPPVAIPSRSSGPVQIAPMSFFSRPPQKQPTQSLAFRLASLSLQEEQARKQPAKNVPPSRDRTPLVPVSISPPSRSPARTVIDLDDAPPTSTIRRPSFESTSKPVMNTAPKPPVPVINIPGEDEAEDAKSEAATTATLPISMPVAPSISISEVPTISISETPSIHVSEPLTESGSQGPSITFSEAAPTISVSEEPVISTSSTSTSIPDIIVADLEGTLETSVNALVQKRKGLVCYGCRKGIVGRIVSAMGGRWHPACFKCSVCSELLEHVSSYEHDGKPYCHLDYHEKFAPQCYHCRTPIVDERYITLDDPALGKRTYHEQHFFCAECGDPFLAPRISSKDKEAQESEVVMQEDDVGFTVYKGHPYCEACHVRLRYPKCKRCKKSIRDGMQAVEALGGKWCWECFLCAGCEKPFDDPAFFQRDSKPYCEPCFSLIIKNEF